MHTIWQTQHMSCVALNYPSHIVIGAGRLEWCGQWRSTIQPCARATC